MARVRGSRRSSRLWSGVRKRAGWIVLSASAYPALGCGILGPPGDAQYPAVQMPTHLEGTPAKTQTAGNTARVSPVTAAAAGQTAAANSLGDAGSDETNAASEQRKAPPQGYLPDPPPLVERALWSYTLTYDRGRLIIGAPALQCLDHPVATPRRIGRFAFELWLGAELIERVRFDFPLLAAEVPREGPRQPMRQAPSFAPGAHVTTNLRVPANSRATRAQILDRATGDTTPVPWPPHFSQPDSAPLCPAPSKREAPVSPTRTP